MIHFEDDARTRGEQLMLHEVLCGRLPAAFVWGHLRPEDFAHDLHGRIFRHATQLAAASARPDAATVYGSMHAERRCCALDGVADYLLWLESDEALAANVLTNVSAFEAFYAASIVQHEAREAAKAAKGDRP